MIIIGELINASRKKIKAAIENRDKEYIQEIAKKQHQAGANYIDVNAGVFVGQEAEYLRWLVQIVQEAVDCPCAIDSPDPKAIEAALEVHQGTAMINSISLEKERYEQLIPILKGSDLKVIALCMSDQGMPQSTQDRLKIADELINGLVQNKIPLDNIFVDPLVQPLSVNKEFGISFLEAIEAIMHQFPGVHTACGLSNISYGLPARKMMNRIFMVMAIAKGLDGAIIDPLDKAMLAAIITAEALAGKDDFCMKYLQAYRSELFAEL